MLKLCSSLSVAIASMTVLVASSEAAIVAGDLVIVEASPGARRVSWAPTRDLLAGESFNLTDRGYRPDQTEKLVYSSYDGIQTYTVPAGGIAAGTVITWTEWSTPSMGGFNTKRDSMTFYNSDTNNPSVIFQFLGALGWPTISNGDYSQIAVPYPYYALGFDENYSRYVGPTLFYSAQEMVTAVGTRSNWTGNFQNTLGYSRQLHHRGARTGVDRGPGDDGVFPLPAPPRLIRPEQHRLTENPNDPQHAHSSIVVGCLQSHDPVRWRPRCHNQPDPHHHRAT